MTPAFATPTTLRVVGARDFQGQCAGQCTEQRPLDMQHSLRGIDGLFSRDMRVRQVAPHILDGRFGAMSFWSRLGGGKSKSEQKRLDYLSEGWRSNVRAIMKPR